MNHEPFLRLISRCLDGELKEADREQLAEHLAKCDSCRAFAEELGGLKEEIASLSTLRTSADTEREVLGRLYSLPSGPLLSFRERWLTEFNGLRAALFYAGVALAIGILAGGIGFRVNNHPGMVNTGFRLADETVRLFDVETSGSLNEVLDQIEKEHL